MSTARQRRKGWRRAIGVARAIAVGLVATAMLLVVLAVALVLSGRSFDAPGALTRRVELMANSVLPEGHLRIGAIQVSLREDMSPFIQLRGVSLEDEFGAERMALPDLRATLDRDALWRGALVPRELSISGARLGFTRDEDGRFDLDLAGFFGPRQRITSIADFLDRLKSVMALPALTPVETIRMDKVQVVFRDLAHGRAWNVTDGSIRLSKDDARISLDLGAPLASDEGPLAAFELSFEAARDSRRARLDTRFSGLDAVDLAAQWDGLEWLQTLQAPISGALGVRVGDDGEVASAGGQLNIAAGVFLPEQNLEPIPFQSARIAFDYLPDPQKLEFTEITFRSGMLDVAASGHAYIADLLTSEQRSFLGQISLTELRAAPADLLQGPVAFTSGAADFRLQLNPFRLDLGQLVLQEDASRLIASGRVAAGPEGWDFAIDASAASLTKPRLMALWPTPLKPKVRGWLDENIKAVEIRDASASIRSRGAGEKPYISYSFDFEQADLRYMDSMPPLQGGAGHASVDGPEFALFLSEGLVEAAPDAVMDAAGSTMRIPDLAMKPALAEIALMLDGPLRAALEILDRPPMAVLSKAGKTPDLAQGRVRASVDLGFELGRKLRPDEIDYAVEGRLTEVASDTLVPGRSLRAAEMTIAATQAQVTVAGRATLDGVPLTAQWTQLMGPEHAGRSRVEGEVEISPRVARTFDVALPDGSLSGKGSAAFELDLVRDKPPVLELSTDLRGVGLRLDALDWVKPAADKGQLALTVRLGQPPQVTRLVLQASGLEAEGSVRLKPGGGLDLARFNRVALGRGMNAAVDLRGRGKNVPPAVEVRGGWVDIRSFGKSGGNSGANGQGRTAASAAAAVVPLSVTLNRLDITDKISLTDFRGELVTRGGLDGNFTGRINGGAPVSGQLIPMRGSTAVRLVAADAGAVLGSAGIFKTARGGAMELILEPVGPKGTYDGSVRVARVRIVDAPWIAELLSAISVVGLLEQLVAEGLHFSDAEAEFRLNPDALIIKKGSAVGPSLGISVEGVYGLASGGMDLQGVISPIYILNGIGQLITRNREGLFGFNYRLTGTAADPQPSVNPLSILAPGFFRDLFRRPPPRIGE